MAKELLDNKAEYEKMAQAKNPFGDGQASRRIVESILYAFGKKTDRPEEYILRINCEEKNKEAKPMKEERLAILSMLEKGIINVDEAERLLTAIHNGAAAVEKEAAGRMSGMLEKAGAALNSAAKTVTEHHL